MKKHFKIIVTGCLLAILLLLFACIYTVFQPVGTNTEKTIYVTIITPNHADEQFEIKTNAEFLRGALEQINLIEGAESEYGLFVKTVNGITADETKNEWWCFTEHGEELYTGIDTSPITDQARYEITLKTW